MRKIYLLITTVCLLVLNACKKDIKTSDVLLHISNLPDLGGTGIYEGWLVTDGKFTTIGKFKADSTGMPDKTDFMVDASKVSSATSFVVSVEMIPDEEPTPSGLYILGGSFNGNSASLSLTDTAALAADFTTITGQYILMTPTAADTTNENSGIWWFDPSTQTSSLSLPALPANWKYEGWVQIGGYWISTGLFHATDGPDESTLYAGTEVAPSFPGEDFLTNPPYSLSFPTDLSGDSTMITLQPGSGTYTSGPFIKVLGAAVPDSAAHYVLYPMLNNAAGLPTGTVTR